VAEFQLTDDADADTAPVADTVTVHMPPCLSLRHVTPFAMSLPSPCHSLRHFSLFSLAPFPTISLKTVITTISFVSPVDLRHCYHHDYFNRTLLCRVMRCWFDFVTVSNPSCLAHSTVQSMYMQDLTARS
jgi:hypothetical protein